MPALFAIIVTLGCGNMDTLTCPTRPPDPPPAGPTPTPTPLPDPAAYAGTWSGRTTEGLPVSFRVEAGQVRDLRITFKVQQPCSNQQVVVDSIPIEGDGFHYYADQGNRHIGIEGVFWSTNLSLGNAALDFLDGSCSNSNPFTWWEVTKS